MRLNSDFDDAGLIGTALYQERIVVTAFDKKFPLPCIRQRRTLIGVLQPIFQQNAFPEPRDVEHDFKEAYVESTSVSPRK